MNKEFSDWYDSYPNGEPSYQETFEAGQAAVLAKLTSGVELPEQSRSFLCTKCGSHECEEGTITKDYPPCAKCGYLGFAASNGHTDEALLAFGASQRLAGREQAIEECKNVVRKKCASPTAYEAIRALAASPQSPSAGQQREGWKHGAYELSATKYANGKELVYTLPDALASYITVTPLFSRSPIDPQAHGEAQPVAWRVRRHDAPNYWIIFMHYPTDAMRDPEREVQPLYAVAAPSPQEQQP